MCKCTCHKGILAKFHIQICFTQTCTVHVIKLDRLQQALCYYFIHSKNVRVKISGSFENDPIWVKCASFNPFSGHTRVNFRTKCLTRNSGNSRKAICKASDPGGNNGQNNIKCVDLGNLNGHVLLKFYH